jgi:hypothetical protein
MCFLKEWFRIKLLGTRTLLEHFNWELFENPPYSPDLTPSHDKPFICLKNSLRSQRFNNNEKLMEGVKTWLISQAGDVLDTGVKKHTPRYEKCLHFAWYYVGK